MTQPAPRVMPITLFLRNDEPAHELYEIHKTSPEGKLRRYRHITVVRDDRLAEHVEDLGPANPEDEQFSIPAGAIEGGRWVSDHTVGELREMADQLRERPFDPAEVPRQGLIDGYFDLMEQRSRVRHGRKPRLYNYKGS